VSLGFDFPGWTLTTRTDIRKFKKWQDAEYTVVGHDMSCMRLAVDGVFGEYEALAAIWILHKGVKVSVGSGFTADQRIKFGANPDLIVSIRDLCPSASG
jgi:DNA ligase-1